MTSFFLLTKTLLSIHFLISCGPSSLLGGVFILWRRVQLGYGLVGGIAAILVQDPGCPPNLKGGPPILVHGLGQPCLTKLSFFSMIDASLIISPSVVLLGVRDQQGNTAHGLGMANGKALTCILFGIEHVVQVLKLVSSHGKS